MNYHVNIAQPSTKVNHCTEMLLVVCTIELGKTDQYERIDIIM